MRNAIISLALATGLGLALGAPAVTAGSLTDVSAARTVYKAKKAECRARANRMRFGMHLVKKNRWVKDCIAGAH